TDIMGEITAASQEQTSGIEQINQAITQMDQVTQQNAALVEEAAAAAASLQEQAGGLVQAVSVFRLGTSSSTAAATHIEPRVTSSGKQASPARAPAKAGNAKAGSANKASKGPRPKATASAAPQLATAGAGDWTEF
ncbi:hypothetical protein ACIPRI_26650, partial [Variovorax sp. LARHSF232]